jgi:hypothetical protein
MVIESSFYPEDHASRLTRLVLRLGFEVESCLCCDKCAQMSAVNTRSHGR